MTFGDRACVLGALHRYMDLVLRGAVEDPLLADAYMGVPGMVAPLIALAQSRIVSRVLGAALKRVMRRSPANAGSQLALSQASLASLRAMPEMRYDDIRGM